MMELREAIEVRVEGWRGGNLPKHTWIRPPRCHRNCPCTRGGVRRRTRRAVRRSPGRRTRRHIRHGKSAADVFLETVTQPFLGFLTAFYRAHPAKRPFDARMVVPVDVIVYQDEHLITGTLLPMLGIDGFRLHAPEESLRVVNRTPIVGLKKFRFDDRRCGSFVCVRIEGDTTTTGSGARR